MTGSSQVQGLNRNHFLPHGTKFKGKQTRHWPSTTQVCSGRIRISVFAGFVKIPLSNTQWNYCSRYYNHRLFGTCTGSKPHQKWSESADCMELLLEVGLWLSLCPKRVGHIPFPSILIPSSAPQHDWGHFIFYKAMNPLPEGTGLFCILSIFFSFCLFVWWAFSFKSHLGCASAC